MGVGFNGVQCCFTSTETIRTIRDAHLDFHTAPGLADDDGDNNEEAGC